MLPPKHPIPSPSSPSSRPPKHLHGVPIRRIATAHGGTHHAMPHGTLHGRGNRHFLRVSSELQMAVSIEKHRWPQLELHVGDPTETDFKVVFWTNA